MEKVYSIIYENVCDRCSNGIMRNTGTIIKSDYEYDSYKHVCDKCGYEVFLKTIYPRYEYKDILKDENT